MQSDLLLDFLEAAANQIIFLRGVYPASVFSNHQKFGVPVMQAEHPWIAQYITEHLRSLKNLLDVDNAGVERFDLVILNDTEKLLETFAFQIDSAELATLAEMPVEAAATTLGEIEFHFRCLLLKLNASVALMKKANYEEQGDVRFSFRIRANMQGAIKGCFKDSKWAMVSNDSSVDAPSEAPKQAIPVYRMTEPFQLEVTILQ